MNTRYLRSGVLLAACLGLCLAAGCPVTAELNRDFSGFTSFAYTQVAIPNVYFCPNFEVPYSLSISHESDGTYLLTYYLLTKGTSGVLSCKGDQVFWDGTCYEHKTPTSRTLTEAEANQVRSVFSSIRYYLSLESSILCSTSICRFDTYKWDNESVATRSYCGVSPYTDMDLDDTQALDVLVRTLVAATQ